jgi:disulfide bond formation protein DsbB
MGLKACPLCFYQRTFLMGLVAVLGMGLLARAARPGRGDRPRRGVGGSRAR